MLPLLADLAARAAREVDPRWHDYLDTGSGTEISRHEAESAWQRYRFRPRVLRMAGDASTAVDLLGTRLQTPVLVAPSAFHRLYAEDGEVATAAGARAAGSLMIASTRNAVPFADVATAAGPWWLQVYLTHERSAIEGLVSDATELGASALVLTVDTPMVATRARGQAAVDSVPMDWQMINLGRHIPDGVDPVRAIAQVPTGLEDIQRFAELSGLPVLVKGVLRADDARACLDAGAAGIVVSNHGGRQLDRAVPTAYALPEVAAAVAGQVPVLADGGIRSGLDVLAALALGADAVLVGRPVVWGLAADGRRGVASVLDALTADLREALTLLGVASPAEVEHDDVVIPFT